MQLLLRSAAVLIGSALLAFGVNAFLAPYRIIDGGFIGIGLLVNYHFGLYPGLTVLLVSAPVFAGVFFVDRPLLMSSLHGLLVTSVLIDLFAPAAGWFRFGMPIHAVAGGWLIGMGVGIMLAYRSNSGGTDLLGQIVHDRTGIPAEYTILLLDAAVLLAGLSVIGWTRTLFSFVTIVTVFVATHRYSGRKLLGREIYFFAKKN
ncbi:YitT family protein [Paenibacillus flagellatus]|uniref:Membrane protein n=1 Tax=Paenibacillus flagellatus TaxID=2211139 RepID=A0A2V5KVX7_9BACL|nr:YitT family protein [Paenibacillus flagellatus]PYI53756.1 membrane protein [Paenibacillus flagellatus]